MKKSLLLIAGAVIALSLSAPASAHHSFVAIDATRVLTMQGTVKELQWTNPHIWLVAMVKQPDGKTVEWAFESQPTRLMRAIGWSADMVKPGDAITIVARPYKNGSPKGSLVNITLPNGKVMNAPDPGAGGRRGGGAPDIKIEGE